MFKKKKFFVVMIVLLLAVSLMFVGCNDENGEENGNGEENDNGAVENDNDNGNDEEPSLAGKHVGYSWGGEADGTSFEDATTYIETILELDDDGVITYAKMNYFVQMDGFWTMRQSGNAYVDVDYSVDPVAATPGEDYEAGTSMFNIYTADMMSFYAIGVDDDGTVAHAIVDPITRYQLEMKFPADFDFETTMGELTIGSENNVPTTRTSGAGFTRPDSWDEVEDNTIFDVGGPWSHVVTEEGVFAGIDNDSTVMEYLEAMEVEFDGDTPQAKEVSYGYFGLGGWNGNYRAIEEDLVGRNATEFTSLVDWSEYEDSINEDNQFGVDTESGATRTVQDSYDTISGATVRISREATSFQRALVDAGILDENDVIIGRF